MNRAFKRILIGTLFAVLAGALSSQALAQASECGKKRGTKSAALDEMTWKKLNDITEDFGEEKYDLAHEKLIKMYSRIHGDYEKAVMSQMLAQVEWARDNFDESLRYFETTVALDALPDQAHFAVMYQIATLYFMNERYDESLDKLELWMCKVPPEKITAEAFVLKASIYAQKKEWANVAEAADTAISMSDDPKEGWYQLKLAAHFELQQFPKAADTLGVMIQKWPDRKDYWVQLSQINYKLERQDEALSVMALAYRRNMLDKQMDVVYLSNLYSNMDVPLKAAEVLQKGIEDGVVEATTRNWTMTADAWYAAEELEEALYAYEQAGNRSEDGEIDLRRAYILVDLERWEQASVAVNAALEKGGFSERKTGDAYVIQGMTEFNLGNFEAARSAWTNATRYPRARSSAEQWLNHMREERARRS